jgi:hypothetical protein
MKRTGWRESNFNANSANKAKASPPAFDPDFSEAGELVPRKLDDPVRARPRRVVRARIRARSVFHSESALRAAFVWARRALNTPRTAISGPGSTGRMGATALSCTTRRSARWRG